MTADERADPRASEVDGWLSSVSADVLASELEAYAGLPALHAQLGALGVPAVVVAGSDDVAAPLASVREIAGLLDAELHVLAGGHGITVFSEAEVGRIVAEFVSRLAGAA